MIKQFDKSTQFGIRSIGFLLFLYALPLLVLNLLKLPNLVVNTVLVGRLLNPNEMRHIAVARQLVFYINLVGTLIGTGAAVCMSVSLGRKDYRNARSVLGTSVLLALVFGVLLTVACYIFMNPILRNCFGDKYDFLIIRRYLMLVLPGVFMTFMVGNLTGLMRSMGYPFLSMLILVANVVLNIIFDFLFVYVFNLGVSGVALSQTLSVSITVILALLPFFGKKAFIGFLNGETWNLSWNTIGRIFYVGLAPFLTSVSTGIVSFIFALKLSQYGGEEATDAQFIAAQVAFFSALVTMLCENMQPIAGYNYGAGQPQRLKSVFSVTLIINVSVGIVAALVALLFPQSVLRIFTSNDQQIQAAIPVLRFMLFMLPVSAVVSTVSRFFLGIGKAWAVIVIDLSQILLFCLPLVFFVPKLFLNMGWDAVTGLWTARAVSVVLGAILAFVLLFSQRKVFQSAE